MTNIKTDNFSFVIEDVSSNPKDWKLVATEEFKPDRKNYILNRFKKDFPDLSIDKYEEISGLSSRNLIVRLWFAKANAEYATELAPPQYLSDILPGSKYNNLIDKIKLINDINRKQSEAEKLLSDEYKEKAEKLEKEYIEKRNEILNLDPYLAVLTLNVTSLPLSLSLAIEKYTPADGQPSKSRYAAEALIQYKRALIKLINENENINISQVINEALGK